jgi:hypothetical protein
MKKAINILEIDNDRLLSLIRFVIKIGFKKHKNKLN